MICIFLVYLSDPKLIHSSPKSEFSTTSTMSSCLASRHASVISWSDFVVYQRGDGTKLVAPAGVPEDGVSPGALRLQLLWWGVGLVVSRVACLASLSRRILFDRCLQCLQVTGVARVPWARCSPGHAKQKSVSAPDIFLPHMYSLAVSVDPSIFYFPADGYCWETD